jgi:hypothetical protein
MTEAQTTACLNCGRPLTGPYCAGCGQKRRETDPTLREFLHETTQELANWDGKIPSTLKTLFFRPGRLTEDFLGGPRARWLQPLRLYLICSLAFFVSKPLAQAISKRSGNDIAEITITNPDGSKTLTPEALEEIEGGLPARVFGRDRLVRAAVNNDQLNREIDAVLPKALFVLLPVFALLTMVAWRRRLPRYPAHLYVSLHLHAAWFGAFAVSTILQAAFTSIPIIVVISLSAVVYVAAYGLLAVRRIFGDSWPTTIAKATAVTIVYSFCLFAVSLSLLAYVLTRM